MKKAFCDVCGKPAVPHTALFAAMNFGAEHYDPEKWVRTRPAVFARIETGFTAMGERKAAEMPDICSGCLVKLAEGLLAHAKRIRRGNHSGGKK